MVTTAGRLFIFGDRGRGKLGLPLENKPNGDAGSDIDDDEVDEPTQLPLEEEV